ncbi:MAG: response regulator [Candidatus Aenigmarchaeota archaeon]|nr:response regulator [Candidatus Aenigmarchaeota archaeon]
MTDTEMSRTALIVEDNIFQVNVYLDIFQKLGYRVNTATDYQTALAHIGKRRYDKYLIDGTIPQKEGQYPVSGNGLELCAEILEVHPKADMRLFTDEVPLMQKAAGKGILAIYKHDTIKMAEWASK